MTLNQTARILAATTPEPFDGKPRMGVYDRTEALMGRTAWTVADYQAHGRETFDAKWRETYPGEREHYAKSYARLACPPAKYRRDAQGRADFNVEGDGL